MRPSPRQARRLAAQLSRLVGAANGPHAARAAPALVIAVCSVGAFLPGASEAEIGPRPCDLYARGGTPCGAAYSTTRAMYGAYVGPLYQVKRASDGAVADIASWAAATSTRPPRIASAWERPAR